MPTAHGRASRGVAKSHRRTPANPRSAKNTFREPQTPRLETQPLPDQHPNIPNSAPPSCPHGVQHMHLRDPIHLDCGTALPQLQVAYQTHGQLNHRGDNAILVCHALTGDAHVARQTTCEDTCPPGWWEALVGPGCPLDTDRFFVVCSNVLGGCSGTTGPNTCPPNKAATYGPDFPAISIGDMVRVQRALLAQLGVQQLALAIGGSMGGMQVLTWAATYPEWVSRAIAIACGARHSAWATAFNSAARLAIRTDPGFAKGRYEQQPRQGLAVARALAMISYRHPDSYHTRFGRKTNDHAKTFPDPFDPPAQYAVEHYLRYQGHKLAQRFDANAYLTLTNAMDRFDLAQHHRASHQVLQSITMPTLCVGINSDMLYPVAEQRELVNHLPAGRYAEISSPHGHDAFLIETEQLGNHLLPFLQATAW